MNKTADQITIFTDGSSRGNPGPGGWGAIVVFGGTEGEVRELGAAEAQTTNNRMELTAAIEALAYVSSAAFLKKYRQGVMAIMINTDSNYLINGATKWIHGWKRTGWMTSQKDPVLNRDLWEKLSEPLDYFSKQAMKIQWNYVGGHSGIAGNERCDEIATGFADGLSDGAEVALYQGSLKNYPVAGLIDFPIFDAIAHAANKTPKTADQLSAKARSRAKAYSYMSMVDGVIERHDTWPECEKRVKGVAGARYKKALTAAEEARIVAEWKTL